MKREIYIKNPGKTLITVREESLTISRKGMLNTINHGVKGEKTIPFKNITAIQLKKPGMTNGYIQFTLLGGNESRGGVFAATADENTLMFSKKYWDEMVKLKNFIESQQSQLNSQNVINNITEKSVAEQIMEFKELLDLEIITEEEFDKKKQELLNK